MPRGTRVLLHAASTIGIRVSAKKTLIATSRMTPRTRHARYSAIPHVTKINRNRTTLRSDGEAKRTVRVSSAGGRCESVPDVRRCSHGAGVFAAHSGRLGNAIESTLRAVRRPQTFRRAELLELRDGVTG